MKTPGYSELTIQKVKGGKKPLWQARHRHYAKIVGAGNTADNAIKDWQRMFKSRNQQIEDFLLKQAIDKDGGISLEL